MKCHLHFLFVAMCLTPAGLAGEVVTSLWKSRSDHRFHQSLEPGMGFSFVYDGKQVGRQIPPKWQVRNRGGDGFRETEFRHASGLVVIRRSRFFPGFDAIEYTLRFKNESREELPVLTSVSALDISFRGPAVTGCRVVSSGGGGADSRFPPKDYAISHASLLPGKSLTLSSKGGYPSSNSMPFFFVENDADDAGIYVAVGWTGNWHVTIQADPVEPTLRIHGGMSDLRIKLRPGEEISSPTVLVGCYHGSLEEGVNVVRRHVRDHYTPAVASRPLVAPIMYTTWFHVGAELDETMARALVDASAEIGQEIFEVDAGWYRGTSYSPYADMRNTWPAISNPLGNWELGEERSRFPSGLEDLAEYARSKGLQFGLWFELERVGPESLLAREHSDWIVEYPNRWGLADFANPEVQDYFCKILDRYITTLKLAYVRWDCNLHEIAAYWSTQDAPDRRGISEIRHIEGIRRVEQFIREHHPNVVLESCASGGRRIDLATLQNRHTAWISDATAGSSIIRFHLEGLNHFIPGSRQLVAFAPATSTFTKPGYVLADIECQCCFAGAFGTAGKLQLWPDEMKHRVRQHVEVYKKLRPFLAEDFYLLVPQSPTLDTWAAWQFHDSKQDAGFVQAFRNRSSHESKQLALRGLDRSRQYTLTDPYSNETFVASGELLTFDGARFTLPQMSSQVLTYRRHR